MTIAMGTATGWWTRPSPLPPEASGRKHMAELGLAGDGSPLRRKDRPRCGAVLDLAIFSLGDKFLGKGEVSFFCLYASGPHIRLGERKNGDGSSVRFGRSHWV
jgi:hypothetical protein